MGCKLLDFDDYAGANRTGQLLLAFRDNAVLLGSAHTEKFDLDDVDVGDQRWSEASSSEASSGGPCSTPSRRRSGSA